MKLSDWIIANGPFAAGDPVPNAWRYPDYFALNELREELIAGRRTPDVDYLRGAAEALAEVRQQMGASDDGSVFPGFERMLRAAAAEIGLDPRKGTP